MTLSSCSARLIALRDCPLLNVSGLHAPYFLRTVLTLEFGGRITGIAEVPGDRRILGILTGDEFRRLAHGQPLTLRALRQVCDDLAARYGELDRGGRGLQSFDTRVLVHVLAAVETAWLDAYGKQQAAPVAAILGDRFGVKPREYAEVNGYLFIIADVAGTSLDYAPERGTEDWRCVRHLPTPDPAAFARAARAAHARYGFKYWKLKGGVLPAETEADFVEAAFGAVGGDWTLDPNGAWSVETAVPVIQRLRTKGCLKYIEDPCRGLENMAACHVATGVPQASNMVGTDWPSLFEAIGKKAVQYPLADPHFWGGPWSGLEVIRAVTRAGCRAGVHSNNHGLISLATVAHMMAASPSTVLAADTHYIFTRHDDPVVSPLRIADGAVEIPPGTVGLGVELDLPKLDAAAAQAERLGTAARNDAVQMRCLPGFENWHFDPDRPSLVR